MSLVPSDLVEGVPFSFFCSLLYEISRAPSHKPASSHQYHNPNYPALNILRRWINRLKKDYSPLPPGTTAIVLKLLFPDEDNCRKFDMQETRFAQIIADCFGIDKYLLDNWLTENASGCLGEELRLLLDRSSVSAEGHISPLSIADVDELLDELASTSGYTDISVRKRYPQAKRRARLPIIKDLFRKLSPLDAGFLTQIILKDLRPILYPLRETHYIAALLGHNTASVKMLSKEDAMNLWDPTKWMLKAYRVMSNLTETANSFELPPSEREPVVPKIGIPVTIPKSEKGRSPRHALQYFRNSRQIWAETKYDGERAQIHVEVQENRTNITIFSKSKRDSTWDRKAVHPCIYHSLGLSKYGIADPQSRVRSNVILDAEMVAFSGEQIDEFWRIQGLIEQTAGGIRGQRRRIPAESQSSEESNSQSSMVTDRSDNRRLGLVFFDILALNGKSLLMTPYCRRRKILEDLIRVVPGEAILSERVPVVQDDINCQDRRQIALEKIFANIIATCQEGVVLKGDETKYHDFSVPWVKLKKDYIPEYGDTLDMVIVGVGWEKARARVLRVPPSTITTFYIGSLENAEEIKRQPTKQPHFQVYFTVSYGPNRRELEEINFTIRNSETVAYSPFMVRISLHSSSAVAHLFQKPKTLYYTFTLHRGLQSPRFIMKTPLLAELFGAGFTKSPQSRHYELRFPRLTKIYRINDRGWRDGINLQGLHKIACEVIGRDSSSKEAKDITAELWGKVASPGAKSSRKRKATSDLWEGRLAAMDGRARARIRRSPSPSPLGLPQATGVSGGSPRQTPGSSTTRFNNTHPRTSSSAPPLQITRGSATPAQPTIKPQPLATKTNLGTYMPTFTSSQERKLNLEITRFSPPSAPEKTQTSATPSKAAAPVPAVVPLIINPPTSSVDHSTTAGSRFLKNALIWFAKPRGKSSPSSNWTLKSSVCRGQQLHSVESLLTGCGWCVDACGSTWADKGVIFVDESDAAGKDFADQSLRTIQERLLPLPAKGSRKTIWIFDTRSWTFDRENIEGQALHRLDLMRPPGHIAVLGGGLTGLSSAFHLSRRFPNARITLLEEQNRLGGWVRSEQVQIGNGKAITVEAGPRTLRPASKAVLELINLLGLQPALLTTPRTAPAARSRFLYVPSLQAGLTALPSSLSALLRSSLRTILFPAILREPLRKPNRLASQEHNLDGSHAKDVHDESLESLLSRRFGSEMARVLGSALCHGVYAADARTLSVRAAFPALYNLEDLGKGRIVLGILKEILGLGNAKSNGDDQQLARRQYDLGDVEAMMRDVAVYSFRGGMQTLSNMLVKALEARPNVQLFPGETVRGIEMCEDEEDSLIIHTPTRTLNPTHIVSTLPLPVLHSILPPSSHGASLPHLLANPASSVTVISLIFAAPPQTIHPPGFGYLVPRPPDGYPPSRVSSKDALGVLGTVFDSCALPSAEGEYTKLTVMLGGPFPSRLPSDDAVLRACVLSHLADALQRDLPPPVAWRVWRHERCIPTLKVGHVQRMAELRGILEQETGRGAWRGRMEVVGAGVGGTPMPFFPTRRLLSEFTNRAIVYSQNGDPSKVLKVLSYRPLPPPSPNTLNVKFILAPINPADLNVIEGVYPAKPTPDSTLASAGLGSSDQPVYVGGNEGLAQVMEVGNGVSCLEKNDWVIMTKPQIGTWCTSKNIGANDVLKIPRVDGLSEVHAATMTVNPPTAYNMLQDFVPLKEGDWVIQNGANSAVGQAVIQIAASRGLKTLNFVRPRDNLTELAKQLEDLGATKVLTYEALSDKSLRKEIKEWTGGKDIKLALNCVSGRETDLMTRLLGVDAHLVSYGAMSKQPLTLATSLFIFKNLTAHGFWQSRWYLQKSRDEQRRLIDVLVNLMSQGKLKEPMHEIISINAQDSDEEATQKVRDVIAKAAGGRHGKKALLRFNVE
ncbi:hypothetical protein FPV67DRAFT_1777589 [Lyophyllum atratum]|nr:hypothetical protein FPV67DRAFT_1777589 [Lyophyllum atratum]